ncbi:MAG: lipoate--protein ligase family protein [Thermoprotei archaeon]|nr:MAG: lipoate--protein ligase family protein [Thermoprotei archaeon]
MSRLRILLYETPDDPYRNLAFEEAFFLARHYDLTKDDTLRIWRNANAVIVGYFQYAKEEVRMDALERIGAKVVRRFTGGGAVYHDLGNINYAITVKKEILPEETLVDSLYKFLLSGAINALRKIGVEARIENVNDIVAGDRKISGCAAKYMKNTLFLHGALLVSTDLSKLASVLKISKKKLADKGVASVKYRVTTLTNLLGRSIGYDEIVNALVEGYRELLNADVYFDLPSREELLLAQRLYKKYTSDEWNFERAPSWKFKGLIEDIIG